MKTHFFITTALLLALNLNAQIQPEKRIEFELRNGYSKEIVYATKDKSFIMESEKDKKVDGQTEIKYDLYDSDLKQVATKEILVPRNMHQIGFYINDKNIYKAFSNKKQIFISSINIKNLETNNFTIEITGKMAFSNMKTIGDKIYLLTKIKKSPIIYEIDKNKYHGKSIPINIGSYSPKKIVIENYQILENSNEILIFTKIDISKGKSEAYYTRINSDGKIENPVKISGVNDNNIITISGNRIDENNIIITGTYTKKGSLSEGLFFGQIENGFVKYIRYYNFLDLKNFLKYLPERKQAKIEKKKEKKEAQNKDFSISYYIADHDVFVLEDGFLFLGEAYYPTYRTETYMVPGPNGTMMTQYRTVFDGYKYTHATLGKFSKDGQLMWDICFEIDPGYKPFVVKRFVAVSERSTSQISMVYTSRNDIVFKTIDFNGKILKDESKELLGTGSDIDKTKRTISSVDYWYENCFLAYGSQVIKGDGNKRKVFFVNKIKF